MIRTEQELREYIEQVVSDQDYEICRRDVDIVVRTYHEYSESLRSHLEKAEVSKVISVMGSGSVNPQKLVYYVNDEKNPIYIAQGTLEGPRFIVGPGEGIWLSIYSKKHEAIYIKNWLSGLVLIASQKMDYELA